MDCPCTTDLRSRFLFVRTRTVGFTDSLDETAGTWRDHHVVFSMQPPADPRNGQGRFVCACEPGYTRIGLGVGVIYGRNGTRLEAQLGHVPGPVVLALIYPGSRTTGGAIGRIRKALEEQGRHLRVHSFDERLTLHMGRGDTAFQVRRRRRRRTG